MRKALTKSILCLMAVTSCTESIDLSSEFERKVTVNLILENKDSQELTLCYNSKAGDFRYEPIEEADVRLFDGDTEVGRFKHKRFRSWALDYRPVPGHTYRLTVDVPSFERITAQTTMPHNVRIQKYKDDETTNDRHKSFVQEMPESPYWIFVMLRHTTSMILENNDLQIEPEDNLSSCLGSNHIALDNFNANDFLMFTDMNLESGESFNHDGYLRIGKTSALNEYPIIFFIESFLSNAIVVFRAASDEYDKYLKSSLIKAQAYEAKDDPSAYFEENVVYSNINGGLGIFAACSDTLIARSRVIDHH